MTFDTVDAVYVTLAFIVPGFIIRSVMAMLIPSKEGPQHLAFLQFLSLSCINYAIWSWLIYLLLNSGFFVDHAGRSAAAWFCLIFIGPVGMGLLLGHLQSKNIIRRLLQWARFTPLHPIPTAWDYKFSALQREVSRYVVVTLKDGVKICGLFASASFASCYADGGDLYLQRIYLYDGGEWKDVQRDDGVLISGDEIRCVEFFTE